MTLESFTHPLLASRRFVDTAVVLVESDETGTNDGTPFSMTFRRTDTWVLEDDGWRFDMPR